MNIQGIEILSQKPITTENIHILVAFFILMPALLLLIGFFMSLFDCEYLFTFVGIAVVVCFLLLYIKFGQEETGRYRYEVTIDDNVAFKELYEKYDIIEQKGKIYVIEEKEVEE